MDRHNEVLNLNRLKGMWQGLCHAQQKAFFWQQSRAAVTGRARWSGMRLQGPTGVRCPNPTDTEEICFCFLPFRITSWFKKVVFCKSLQLKSLSQTIPAHCITLELCGLPLEGGNGLNNVDRVAPGTFWWSLASHEDSVPQSLYDSEHKYWSVTGVKTQVWKPRNGPIVSFVLASLPAGSDGKWLLLERHIEVLQTGSLLSPARCRE